MEAVSNVTGIKYTQDGVFCPGNNFQSEKTFENGTNTGAATIKGQDAVENPVGIWVT